MSTAKVSRVIFLRETSKSSNHFFNIISEKVVKQHSTCPREYFWKICFFLERSLYLENLLTSAKYFSVFSKKVSAELSKLYSTCPGEALGENFLGNLLVAFNILNLGQKKLNFRWKRFHSLSQLFITCTRQQFEEKCVSRVNWIIIFFGVLVKSFPRGPAEYHSTCSHPFFELLIIFS